LLFAAGHRDGLLIQTLGEPREDPGDAFDQLDLPFLFRRRHQAQPKICPHGKSLHDTPLFRNGGEAKSKAHMRRLT